MRGGRSLLILLVVALGLGAYIYFVEMKREPAGDTSVTKKDKVFTAESSKIEEISLKAVGGETTTLKKKNNVWEIVAPQAFPADSSEIGGLLSTLESLEIQSVVAEQPASGKEYELDPPRFTVSFKAEGAAAPMELQIGRKTPTGGDLYAKVAGQPKVFLISAFLEPSLNKTTFNLRDKTILKFEREGADSLTIEKTGSPALAFVKKGGDWRFSKPYDAKADGGIVDGMVGKLAQARMAAAVTDDGTKELAKYGLDKPQTTVIVGSGSARATLAFGSKKDDGSIFARDVSRPAVFTVESALLDDLTKNPDDLRRKDLFEFRSFSAVRFEVTIAGQTLVFEKTKAPAPAGAAPDAPPPPDVWKQTKPTAKDVDQTKITDLLTNLSNLKAEKFAEKAQTGGDEVTVTAKFGDTGSPNTETVKFRKSGSVVHAVLSGETGAAVVPTAEYDRALALIKELAGIK